MLWLHNLKKSKGQYISFGIIICITALIMNIALVLANQSSDAYDKRFEELNTAEINFMILEEIDNDDISEKLFKINGIEYFEKHRGVFANATVREFSGSDFDMNTVFYSKDEERNLNKLEITGEDYEDAIYIPEYITELGGFTLGENITYSIYGKDYTYKIGGTVQEMQYGNYGTGLIGAYLPQKLYDEFKKGKVEAIEYSLKISENADISQTKTSVSKLLSNENISVLSIADCESGKQSRTMVCNLLIAVFIALSAIILAVSIFLSNFKIRNTIEAEMAGMGVLKALGYTNPMIISGVVIPYTLVGLIASITGAALSYAVLPGIAHLLGIQSGFLFVPKFALIPLLVTVLVPVCTIWLFSYIAAQKIRKTEPINAIRGITGGASDRNYFALEETAAPIKFTLILKQIASSAGQNILLFAVSFVIMVLICFVGTLVYNVNIKTDNFINTIQEESPSVIFVSSDTKELRNILEKDERTSLVLDYASAKVSHDDGSLTAFVCEDFSKVRNDICYEGKNPKNENEIALGSALYEKYKIGDTIEIKNVESSHKYTVTGFIQSVNNGGDVCELTNEGYKKISDVSLNSLNIYLHEKGAEDFISEYEEKYGDKINSSLNYEKLSENGTKMYAGIVSAVTLVIMMIAVLIVLLVMYVIISSLLVHRKQEFGIYKAIGWSSRQLIIQNAAVFLPSIAAGGILSTVLGLLYLPAINQSIFALLGAYKNHFVIPLWFLLIFTTVFIVICLLISVLLAMPIKKITAYSLLKE